MSTHRESTLLDHMQGHMHDVAVCYQWHPSWCHNTVCHHQIAEKTTMPLQAMGHHQQGYIGHQQHRIAMYGRMCDGRAQRGMCGKVIA